MVIALRAEASPASFTYSPIHRSVIWMELKGQEACYCMCVCVWGGGGVHTDHPLLGSRRHSGPETQRMSLWDLPCSLDIFSFLICKNGEGNRTVLGGLLKPFNLVGLLIQGI